MILNILVENVGEEQEVFLSLQGMVIQRTSQSLCRLGSCPKWGPGTEGNQRTYSPEASYILHSLFWFTPGISMSQQFPNLRSALIIVSSSKGHRFCPPKCLGRIYFVWIEYVWDHASLLIVSLCLEFNSRKPTKYHLSFPSIPYPPLPPGLAET